MQYRCVFVENGCYFFTVVTEKRRPIFADKNALVLLREAFKNEMLKLPFTIDAMVVLSDHLHCIWTLRLLFYSDSEYFYTLCKINHIQKKIVFPVVFVRK